MTAGLEPHRDVMSLKPPHPLDHVDGNERQHLIEDKDKCCPHVYLVVFKCVMVLFVIPALIIASILLWIVWLILLPTTVFCPCCDLCAAVVKFLWKVLSKLPVYLMDWVCGTEKDDSRYQMSRKRRRKTRIRKSRKSYSTMETQTQQAENSDGHIAELGEATDVFQDAENSEMVNEGTQPEPAGGFELDLSEGINDGPVEGVHGQGPPYGDLGPLVEEEEHEEDLIYVD